MARVILTERPDSRKWTIGENASFELRYNATGDSDPFRIKSVAMAEIPTWWEGLVRTSFSIDPDPLTIDSVKGKGIWLVVASYSVPVLNGVKQTFDTSGATFKITQSIKTQASYARLGSSPTDHKGAINVDGERVNGVDIVVPVHVFSETYELTPYVVTPSYKGVLFNLTGKTNNKLFRGFLAGECLFMGASGSLDQNGFYQVDFKFAASPELRNFTVGDITVLLKRGWEYVWTAYEKKVDDASFKVATVPSEVYVEQVYRDGDFSTLGIGTGLVPVIPR